MRGASGQVSRSALALAAEPQPEPEPEPESAPPPEGVPASGRAARLAALTGGAVGTSSDGQASVVFAPSAPTLSRVPDHAPPAPPPTTSSNGASANGAAASAGGSALTSLTPLDLEELYDRLSTRLRRELLRDADRAGHLLRDLP